jgi:hypothetical protein
MGKKSTNVNAWTAPQAACCGSCDLVHADEPHGALVVLTPLPPAEVPERAAGEPVDTSELIFSGCLPCY